MELDTDANGVVTFAPIVQWGVSIVQGKTVGLAVDYFANARDVQAKQASRLQLHMDPAAAKELARVLNARADTLLSGGG